MAAQDDKDAVLLITAFEPFDGAKTNGSLILLEKMKEKDWGGRVVFLGPVPVSFEDAWPIIEQEIRKHPNIKGVIGLGQAAGIEGFNLEGRAVNVRGGHMPDNYGYMPKKGEPVVKGGAGALWTKFPWRDLGPSKDWELSLSAGTYVCNNVMYEILNWAKNEGKVGGFIHVPLMASQKADQSFGKDAPVMDEARAVAAFERIIDFSLQNLEPKPASTPANSNTRKPAPPKVA